MPTTYRPEADVYTSGAGVVILATGDGQAKVELYLGTREAFALAAAIDHTAAMSARGIECGTEVEIEP